MTTRTVCSGCRRVFAFDTDQAPAQRIRTKNRGTGRVITYYPTCPHCRERVEVDNPLAPQPQATRLAGTK
jgi:hypothetical protein